MLFDSLAVDEAPFVEHHHLVHVRRIGIGRFGVDDKRPVQTNSDLDVAVDVAVAAVGSAASGALVGAAGAPARVAHRRWRVGGL